MNYTDTICEIMKHAQTASQCIALVRAYPRCIDAAVKSGYIVRVDGRHVTAARLTFDIVDDIGKVEYVLRTIRRMVHKKMVMHYDFTSSRISIWIPSDISFADQCRDPRFDPLLIDIARVTRWAKSKKYCGGRSLHFSMQNPVIYKSIKQSRCVILQIKSKSKSGLRDTVVHTLISPNRISPVGFALFEHNQNTLG